MINKTLYVDNYQCPNYINNEACSGTLLITNDFGGGGWCSSCKRTVSNEEIRQATAGEKYNEDRRFINNVLSGRCSEDDYWDLPDDYYENPSVPECALPEDNASKLETAYQRYRNLRQTALDVCATKIEEYPNPDYEKICMVILFEFDTNNQRRVAERLGVTQQQLLNDLAVLSTGARLNKQRK